MRYPQPNDPNPRRQENGKTRYPTAGQSSATRRTGKTGSNGPSGTGPGGQGKGPSKAVLFIVVLIVIVAIGLVYALVRGSSSSYNPSGLGSSGSGGSGSSSGSGGYTPPPQLQPIKLPLDTTIEVVMDAQYTYQDIEIEIPADDTYVINITSDGGMRYNADLMPDDYTHPLRYADIMDFQDRGPQLRPQFGGVATDKIGQNYLEAGNYELSLSQYEDGETHYEVTLTREAFDYPYSVSGVVPELDAPQVTLQLDETADISIADNKAMWIGEIILDEPGYYGFDYRGAVDEHILLMLLDVESLQTWTSSYRSSTGSAPDGDFSEPYLPVAVDAGTYYVIVLEEYPISGHDFSITASEIDF